MENYCQNCGAQNSAEANFCLRCGYPKESSEPQYNLNSSSTANIFLVILSVIFPLLGLVFYGLYRYSKPRPAKVYLYSAAVMIMICVVLGAVIIIGQPILTK